MIAAAIDPIPYVLKTAGGSPCDVCLQAGGVLDPNAQLKLSDFNRKVGCEKLMGAMNGSGGSSSKSKNKRRRTEQGNDGGAVEAC